MTTLRIAETKDRFVSDGRPFFYLADTVWNVFTNATEEEWEEYLRFRSAQGFNAVQISVLPIEHDMSSAADRLYPFDLRADGSWDFYKPNEMYFEKAARMSRRAREYGLTPALVLLWASFAPDTWAAGFRPELVMTEDAIEGYVTFVVEKLGGTDPVYLVSGDTNFPSEATFRAYGIAMRTLKRLRPDALTTYHPVPNLELDAATVNDPQLDFYMYQQGHSPDAPGSRGAKYHYGLPVKRPIVNGEPQYEGIGYFKQYGRFVAADIRRAFWQSVLHGAKAGFTYGAHGVWSWHAAGQPFTSEELWGTPCDWRTAMRFQGAQDVAFCKWLFETYDLFDLEPASHLLLRHEEHVALAMTPDRRTAAMYLPHNMGAKIDFDFAGYDCAMIEFGGRNVASPRPIVRDGVTEFGVHGYNGDALIVARKRG
jgi:hypothetical protein